MGEFELYSKLGFTHITDLAGYDHILFLIALCAAFSFKDWRKLLILVTAFTIGHSLTLVLTAFKMIEVNGNVIEFLIALTIFLTGLGNLIFSSEGKLLRLRYPLALIFGLIHGMGFSGYFSSLMGKEANIIRPLLYFNIGLELGQLLIVGGILLLGFVACGLLKFPQKWWRIVLSSVAMLVAIWLMVERI